ncbi:MAG: KOW domain-containing RNA-binding protein [Oscillospiraceae bacterium]|nr:KOW domain-containing RNA-binding protein [Oscillospiraceae bacterium]
MRIEKADVVIPLNGRDAGKRFIVVGTEDDYSLLADGKGRRVEKPKRKKNKHVKVDDRADGSIAEKLIEGERVTNSEIRRALTMLEARGEKGGM